jgi:hypothetical protein
MSTQSLTDTTRAAARRCLLTLTELGYLTHDGKHFAPTLRMLRLGGAYLGITQLPVTAHPYLVQARNALNESVCYDFGVNALERGEGIRPETSGVAAGFHFTGSGIGGFVFPTIIARIVDVLHTGAGLVGPIVLLTAGTILWMVTFAPRWRRAAGRATVVAQQATAGQ